MSGGPSREEMDAWGEVRQQLGTLIGQMQGVIERMDRADESRTRTHERLNDQADQISDLKHSVSSIATKAAATDAKVDLTLSVLARVEALERTRQNVVRVASFFGTHIGQFGKWLFGLIGLALIAFWRELVDLFTGK